MKKRKSKQPQTTGLPSEYVQLLADIKARVRSAQLAAFRAVNKELVWPRQEANATPTRRRVRHCHTSQSVA